MAHLAHTDSAHTNDGRHKICRAWLSQPHLFFPQPLCKVALPRKTTCFKKR